MEPDPLAELQDALGYRFERRQLLEEALTHPSAGEAALGPRPDFNRLEFLGDRVLGLVIADDLMNRHADEAAGQLALRYNALVRRDACTRVALDLGLGRFIRLAGGESENGVAAQPAILADCCEAVIAAIYTDGGLEPARAFVRRHWAPVLDSAMDVAKDSKTMLQEWAHRMALPPPAYRVLGTEGPPHQPVFTIEVEVAGSGTASGRGTTKRAAEQEAAAALLEAADVA